MRASMLSIFKVNDAVDYSFQDLPDRALLRALLSRAIYDLTPEASVENRRDAIRWFERKHEIRIEDADVTSYQRVKSELNLGCRFTKLLKEVLSDAKSFQTYALKCKKLKQPVDIVSWVADRKQYRALNQKPGTPSIAFRKSSYA